MDRRNSQRWCSMVTLITYFDLPGCIKKTLVCVRGHCWISLLPSMVCFLLNKTSSSSVLILFLITMPLSTSTSRRGCFFGGPDFWGLLAAFRCLAYMVPLRPARSRLSRQGWPGLVLKCGSIFVTYVYAW